jgi:hypothetical protein
MLGVFGLLNLCLGKASRQKTIGLQRGDCILKNFGDRTSDQGIVIVKGREASAGGCPIQQTLPLAS